MVRRPPVPLATPRPTTWIHERLPAPDAVTVAPPGSVIVSPFWNVPVLLRSLMKPVPGMAAPAVAGFNEPVAQTRVSSPVAPEVPPVTPLLPSAFCVGTLPEDAENGTSQTCVPSIRKEPPSVAESVTAPNTAACWFQRTSASTVTEPPLMVMVSPLSRPLMEAVS